MKRGFSLIELLIVIAIMGIIAISGFSNYFTSVTRSRDVRRKTDVGNIQKGLELYYADKGTFPTTGPGANTAKLCENGFVDSGSSCTGTAYVLSVPKDPGGSAYYYVTDAGGTYFKLYSAIERTDDTGTGVNQSGYAATSCNGSLCKYGVSSTNTTP